MANISADLAAIQAAILGKDVRGSIHHAISEINKVSEVIFTTGSTDPTGNALYSKLLYLNLTTWDLFQSSNTSPYTWSKIGNIEGNAITSITGPVAVSALVDEYTIHFSKLPNVTFQVANGLGITSISKTSVAGLVDTYTITYNDGTTQNYDVTNGKGIASIQKTGVTGLIDTYTITYNDGSTQTYDVGNGKGITSITLKQTVGLTDTYTITYNDGTTQDYDVVNGKDGNTVLRGNEVTGQALSPTQFTISQKCQTGDTYINISGYVYTCTSGAPANTPSLWKYDFAMSGGGGGGVQKLDDLSDVNASNPTANQYLQFDGNYWVPTSQSGSGHTMTPTPDPSVDEEDIVTAVNAAQETNIDVSSLFGIQKWSNMKTFRVVYDGTIGHTGIGEWQYTLNNPSAADEAGWGWWHHDIFQYLDPTDDLHTIADGYDVEFSIKFDPGSGEIITLGGYQIDTDTGYMCIRFGNYVVDTSKAKVIVDVTFTRNDISVM